MSINKNIKILANVRLYIEDIYIRIEDSVQEFSFGFKIPSITVLPCDKDWNRVHPVQNAGSPVQYKNLTIKNLEVFINTAEKNSSGSTYKKISEELKMDDERRVLPPILKEASFKLAIGSYPAYLFIKLRALIGRPRISSGSKIRLP